MLTLYTDSPGGTEDANISSKNALLLVQHEESVYFIYSWFCLLVVAHASGETLNGILRSWATDSWFCQEDASHMNVRSVGFGFF